MEFVILFSAIALIICAFLPSDNDEHVIKFMVLITTLGFFAWSIFTVGYDNGIEVKMLCGN